MLKNVSFLKVAVGLWGLGPVGGTVGVLGCWDVGC